MLVAVYASYKDPKLAGLVWLAIGVILAAGGVWGAVTQSGAIGWVLIGAGAFIAGVGWLLRQGID
jgi:hypothetical protein